MSNHVISLPLEPEPNDGVSQVPAVVSNRFSYDFSHQPKRARKQLMEHERGSSNVAAVSSSSFFGERDETSPTDDGEVPESGTYSSEENVSFDGGDSSDVAVGCDDDGDIESDHNTSDEGDPCHNEDIQVLRAVSSTKGGDLCGTNLHGIECQLKTFGKLFKLRVLSHRLVASANRLASGFSSGGGNTDKTAGVDLTSVVSSRFEFLSHELDLLLRSSMPACRDLTKGHPAAHDEASAAFSSLRETRSDVFSNIDSCLPSSSTVATANNHLALNRQVDHALTNTSRLLKRSHLKRNPLPIIGDMSTPSETPTTTGDVYLPEIFDDTDFFEADLRHLLQSKRTSDALKRNLEHGDVTNSSIPRKRKVDTRASKGRKIRYDAHSKLVSFMMPYERTSRSWNETATDNLFRSLFGCAS